MEQQVCEMINYNATTVKTNCCHLEIVEDSFPVVLLGVVSILYLALARRWAACARL